MKQDKQTYIAPELTIVTVAAERGFAESVPLSRHIELILDWNPVEPYTVVNNNTQHFGNPNDNDPLAPSNNFWNF